LDIASAFLGNYSYNFSSFESRKEEEKMNETAAGMSQTMPLYLIGVGILLIAALAYLLLKMRQGKEEAPGGEETTRPVSRPEEAPMAGEAPRAEKEAEAQPRPMEKEEAPATPQAEAPQATLPVEREPFLETPEIGRGDFERFAGRRVLVVEDNPVNRKLILTLMAKTGIELDSAEDGVEALEKLRAPDAAFDLVLMDVNMPKMDGLECTRQIRQDAALRAIPVLALTASTTPEEVEAILESGMNGYLDKPLNLGKLYTAFVRFIEEYRVPREAEGHEGGKPAAPEVETDREILDPEVGLEHSNGDAGLYRSLLEDFLQQYGDSAEQFGSLVAGREYEGLYRLVVDLEGLAGMLGAKELYRLLLEIHRILDQGTTMILGDYVEEYAEALERLKREIHRYLGH
jgi:CheY-like chemotaxis protein